MPTVILIRHGRTAANAAGVLAGWTPGVFLDATGAQQAQDLGQRLATVPLSAVLTSPLERCQGTAAAVQAAAAPAVARADTQLDERLGECHYGTWTGQELTTLSKDPLWPVVQRHPSAMRFPGPDGESLAEMQHRAVSAIREHDARIAQQHGPNSVWAAVSHGDVIKAILADALGLHLDGFQRIHVSPCSMSIVQYTETRPFIVRINDVGSDLAALLPGSPATDGAASADAAVGGGA
jgi:probable phosphomutase (TIGR03848 family)